ncbi:MAG: hypothetical protein NTY69_05265 [Methylococcales bacterium]|nr:hypothetical protein [Methylococcales bacterium]
MRTILKIAFIVIAVYWLNPMNTDSNPHQQTLSQFVSLNSTDEYVLAKFQTLENIHHLFVKHIPYTDIPYGKIDANLSVMVHYRYHIKLSELSYSLNDDTLVFTLPRLYLMTPVAHDTSTLSRKCHSVLLASCKNTLNTLMTEVSSVLADRGKDHKHNVYDVAAKALADRFDAFMKLNEKPVFYRAIVVVFEDENTPSQRVFRY